MSTGDWIQVSVLGATLLAVCWYAWEARKQARANTEMAREMREQRLLTTRPILLLSPVAEEHGRWNEGTANEIIRLALPGPLAEATPVRIANVGAGVAVEIKVPYKLSERSPAERVIDYLAAGSAEIENNFHLAPAEESHNQRTLKITYHDVFGNSYESRREFQKQPDSQHYVFTALVHRELPRR
jgi:hypothetical protein